MSLTFRFSCMHVHLFWFPPPTWAAIALQTHLAHPPPTSWPCATTPTSSSIDSTSIFCGKPCQNRHAFENSPIFTLFCTGPAPIPPTPPPPSSLTCGDYCPTFLTP